jgi:hypothetical protein
MTMAEPRKHHYLPQFYLRGFSQDGQSLYQIEKATARGFVASIRDIAAIRDYHHLDYNGAEDSYELEKKLSEVEDTLANVLCIVLQDGIKTPGTHAGIVELVSLLRFRVPAIKTAIEESLRQIVRTTGLILERAGRLPKPPEGLEDVLRINQLNIEISNWICLQYMFRLASDPDLLRLLLSMKPTILRVRPGSSFITCDQPVAIFHPTAMPDDPFAAALVDLAIEISLPLSNNSLVLLTWRSDAPDQREIDAEEVAEFNRRTVVMASSWVFASAPFDWITNLVRSNTTHFAGIQTPEMLNLGKAALHKINVKPVLARKHYS